MSDSQEYQKQREREERYPSFYSDSATQQVTEVESDEFDAERERLPSITPEEWAEIKRMTRQESIRPSNIEEPETPLQSDQPRFNFDDEYTRHFGKPFGSPDVIGLEENEEVIRKSSSSDEEEPEEETQARRPVFKRPSIIRTDEDGNESEEDEYDKASDSGSSIDSARFNGSGWFSNRFKFNPKFGRQYSNPDELFTPPPEAVPEFPDFPDEFKAAIDDDSQQYELQDDHLPAFTARRSSSEFEGEEEIEAGRSFGTEAMGNCDELLDWVNRFTICSVDNFKSDFENPAVWVSLMAGILSELGHDPGTKVSSYAKNLGSAYEYVNGAMNKLGIDERNELQLLMNPDDMFGGHALLNQTLVSLLHTAVKTKMVMDQARGSPSDPDTASEDDVALYHPPESSEDLSEMSLDTRPETPPLPEDDEAQEPATNDSSDWKSEPVEPESADIETPATKPTSKSDGGCPFAGMANASSRLHHTINASISCLIVSLYFCLSK